MGIKLSHPQKYSLHEVKFQCGVQNSDLHNAHMLRRLALRVHKEFKAQLKHEESNIKTT